MTYVPPTKRITIVDVTAARMVKTIEELDKELDKEFEELLAKLKEKDLL